jgi:AcrR family transcriptional regulator
VEIPSTVNDPALVALRRAQIAEHAARLFARDGYDKTSIGAIAKSCNMSKGNIYNYVGSKSDILRLVIDNMMEPTRELTQMIDSLDQSQSASENLETVVRSLYEWSDRFQDSVVFFYSEAKSLDKRTRATLFDADRRLIKAIEKLLAKGCAEGEFQIDDTKTKAHEIVVLAEIWAVGRWFLSKHDTLQGHIAKRTESILRSLHRN